MLSKLNFFGVFVFNVFVKVIFKFWSLVGEMFRDLYMNFIGFSVLYSSL